MKFSVVAISKNEGKTLPKLLESVKGVDEIIICDTGSTDNTIKVAESFGAKVIQNKFDIIIDKHLKKEIDKLIGENDIKVGDKAFNFAEARNLAAQHARNDLIFMPDCDEVVEWDLPEVEKLLDTGINRLEYNFVFSWDNEGKPLIQFIHSKFYNRKKLKWVRNIHEVLSGEGKSQFTDKIFLKHYQNQETNRSQYLKGLAIDYIQNPYNDRNTHYFARELLYSGKSKEAIKMFEQHIENPGWETEKGQSLIFMGNAYRSLKDDKQAMECYARGFTYDMNRREALLEMAKIKYDNQEWAQAERLYWLALQIPKSNYYADFAPHYTHIPWGQLSVCLFNQGKKEEAHKTLLKALEYEPKNPTYLNNLKFFEDNFSKPKVSIVIPTMGREEKLQRCLQEIGKNADYPDYEVIVMRDDINNRKGVPTLVKEGVEKSTGELVMYLANDVIPQPGFLKEAVKKMHEAFGNEMDGLVGLNDMYWHGEIATHWLASKKLLPYLGGEFFHTGYHHICCDNELTLMCKKIDRYVWAEEAKVYHDHPIQGDWKDKLDEGYKIAYNTDNAAKDKGLLMKRSRELGFEIEEHFIHPSIKLSAIVTMKDNFEMTINTIKSLIENTKSLGQIIIIDDDSKEDFKPYVEQFRGGKELVGYYKIKKSGLIKAWNLGASLVKFPYFVICNNDILFSPDWDKPLIRALNDDVWMVSPYHTQGELPGDFPKGTDRAKNIIGQEFGLPFIGSCFMMKKETWKMVGPIDERLNIWCGDNYIYDIIKTDFEKEVKEITESYIHHFGRVTTSKLPKEILEEDIITHKKIYNERNLGERREYCYTMPVIDLRLKLPTKDLHNIKALNVGVGSGKSGISNQLPYLNFKQLDHIDIYEPYLEGGKKLEWTSKEVNFIKADVRDYDFIGYDVIMMFDILEHLEKEESLKVLERAEKSGARIFIFIPLEKEFRKNKFGVESQDHKSLWTEKDFLERGYKTKQLINFHGDSNGNGFNALWAIK